MQIDRALLRQFTNLIEERIGLKEIDEQALLTATHDAGYAEPHDYYSQLHRASTSGLLWSKLIQHLPWNPRGFFANAAQFQALSKHILPEIIQSRRQTNNLYLKMWSAGCGTGEEPYSLAILLRELLPDVDDWHITILATDINQTHLLQAAQAVYHEPDLSNRLQTRYGSHNEDNWQLASIVQRMVHFDYLNLVEEAHFPKDVDLIICNRVLSHFDHANQVATLKRFDDALVTDGWLLTSEPLDDQYPGFAPRRLAGTVVYQKAAIANRLPLHPATPFFALVPPTDLKSYAQTCCDKGKMLADQGKWSEAHQWLTRALAHNPLLLQAHFTRAMVYMQEGDDQAALEVLQRALYIDSSFVLAHFNTGLLHWRMGHMREAYTAWNKTCELLRGVSSDDILPHSDGVPAGYVLSLLNAYMEKA